MAKTLSDFIKEEYEKSKIVVAKRLEWYAKRNHRYKNRTGNLTRSISVLRTRPYQKMKASMFYANNIQNGFHPYGNKNAWWEPDPFLKNAIEENKDFIRNEYRLAVVRGTRRFNREGGKIGNNTRNF